MASEKIDLDLKSLYVEWLIQYLTRPPHIRNDYYSHLIIIINILTPMARRKIFHNAVSQDRQLPPDPSLPCVKSLSEV